MSTAGAYDRYLRDGVVNGEGVEVDVPATTAFLRALSTIIDAFIYVILGLLTMFTGALLLGGASEATGRTAMLLLIIWSFFILPGTVELLLRGKTPAKYILGLRTVRDDGGAIGPRQAYLRALVGLVEFAVLTGLPAVLMEISTKRAKRLGDVAAGTYVISERSKLQPRRVPPMPPTLAEWARSADVARISPQLDLSVRAFLERSATLPPDVRERLGLTLYSQVAARIFPPPPAGSHPDAVMLAVLAERRTRDLARLTKQSAARAAVLPPDPLDPAPLAGAYAKPAGEPAPIVPTYLTHPYSQPVPGQPLPSGAQHAAAPPTPAASAPAGAPPGVPSAWLH